MLFSTWYPSFEELYLPLSLNLITFNNFLLYLIVLGILPGFFSHFFQGLGAVFGLFSNLLAQLLATAQALYHMACQVCSSAIF